MEVRVEGPGCRCFHRPNGTFRNVPPLSTLLLCLRPLHRLHILLDPKLVLRMIHDIDSVVIASTPLFQVFYLCIESRGLWESMSFKGDIAGLLKAKAS